jgi:hypothetical protein
MERAMTRLAFVGEQLLLPIDRVRASIHRWVLGNALGAGLIRKDVRVAVQAIVAVGIAGVLTLCAPLVLFAVAPVALGVPHLAADVRYLVLAPRYGRAARAWLLVGCASFFMVRLLPLLGLRLRGEASIEIALAVGALGVAAAFAALSANRPARAAIVASAIALIGLFAYRHAEGARLVFAHLHNAIAIVVWALLFRARQARRWTLVVPVAMTAVLTLLLVVHGATHAATLGQAHAFGLSLASVASWLAPGLPLRAGIAIVLTYVFLQSVHYTVWLGLIPTEAVRGQATRSFRMSLRALGQDFGAIGLVVVALLSLAMLGLAAHDLNGTRNTYLTLSAFHGYLELAALVVLACGRRDLWMRDGRVSC